MEELFLVEPQERYKVYLYNKGSVGATFHNHYLGIQLATLSNK